MSYISQDLVVRQSETKGIWADDNDALRLAVRGIGDIAVQAMDLLHTACSCTAMQDSFCAALSQACHGEFEGRK